MKKVITTLTALAFALGLASLGLAQTDKPAVKPETPAASTPVAKPGEPAKPPVVEPQKPGAAAKPAAKEEPKAGEQAKSVTGKDHGKTKKATKKVKEEKKPVASVTPAEKPKEEPKK